MLLIFSLGNPTFGLLRLTGPEENENTVFTNAEYELIKDLISGNEQGRNYIFLGSTPDINCSNFTCEKYSMVNLAVLLSARAERIYSKTHIYDRFYTDFHERVIKNAGSSESNIIIWKQASLSSNEDVEILDYIRSYNMKSYLVVFAGNDEIFSKLKDHILSSELFNIYVIKEFSNNQVQLIYEVCAYCSKGKHELQFYNGWKQSRGFLHPFKSPLALKEAFMEQKLE